MVIIYNKYDGNTDNKSTRFRTLNKNNYRKQ